MTLILDKIAGFTEILRVEVGSTAHGVSVGDDDRDEMGVCIEPPEYVIGLASYEGQNGFEQFSHRTAWERTGIVGPRHQPQPASQPGDLDLIIYSLRKWCRMALSGNPTTLLVLFSTRMVVDSPLGQKLRALAPAFYSRHAGTAYLKYMEQQRERLQGSRGQKDVNRPELVAKYGFDTKYAGHVIRLGIQGCEYIKHGRLAVPMEPESAAFVQAVRSGDVPYGDVLKHAESRERLLKSYLDAMSIPDEPDTARVNLFLVTAYSQTWMEKARLDFFTG